MTEDLSEGGILVNMPGGGSKWFDLPESRDPNVPLKTGKWTPEEEYLLVKLYAAYGVKTTARALNRPHDAVTSMARRMGVKGAYRKPVRLPLADTLGRVA